MLQESIIQETVDVLQQLSDEQVRAVGNYARRLLESKEEEELQRGIEAVAEQGGAFDFLKDEEDLYTADHVIEPIK